MHNPIIIGPIIILKNGVYAYHVTTIMSLLVGHRPQIIMTLLCALYIPLIIILTMGTTIGLVLDNKCHDYEVIAIVYPEDTIVASTLTYCPKNTLNCSKPLINPINAYVAPCDAVIMGTTIGLALNNKWHDYEVIAIVYPEDIILAATVTYGPKNTLRRSKLLNNPIDAYVAPCDAGTTIGLAYALDNKWHDYEVIVIVYPEDTTIVSTLTYCPKNSSRCSKPLINPIDAYLAPCDAVKEHSVGKNYISIMYPDCTFGKQIIDMNLSNNISNYVHSVKNSVVTLRSTDGAETLKFIFICIKSKIFSNFLYSDDKKHFWDVINSAIRCNKLELQPNASIIYKMAFQVNITGYYFVGISPSYNTRFSVQFNLSVSSNYYDRSDFLQYHINCSLSTENSYCPVNNSYTNTYIMMYASPSLNSNNFNYITVKPEPSNIILVVLLLTIEVLCLTIVCAISVYSSKNND